eukprot:Partr_v1_DN27449_c3_g1_i2_m72331 putative AAA family ATPase
MPEIIAAQQDPQSSKSIDSVVSSPIADSLPFNIDTTSSEPILKFSDNVPLGQNCISLKSVLRQFISSLAGKQSVPARAVYNVIGKLRSLRYVLDQYNKGVQTNDESQAYLRHVKVSALQLFSVFGFQVSSPRALVSINGLEELIRSVEKIYADEIAAAKELIAQGVISFEGLMEVYKSGEIVQGVTSLGGARAGFRVVHGYYEERRSLFGMEKSFHLQLEFIASMGTEFAVISFEHVMSGWMGSRTRVLADLDFYPVNERDLASLITRGSKYGQFGSGGPKYLSHGTSSFFMHGIKEKGLSGASSSQIGASGRIMIDVARGASLGHYASQGFDEPTQALMSLAGRYKRMDAKTPSDAIILFDNIPDHLLGIAWPALVGFSFSIKAWGHILVDSLQEIKFNENAFDTLVLDPDRKKLIRALVKFGGGSFTDVIEGKSGGSIFLLHGPPGVGKTLTAEAIAETLHRPLYYVTMGELGTSPDDLERRLGDVLSLCAVWDALVLIDEADVFLEKRSTSDVLRNAMVCVMLRLLEYHQGILFLTTNRVTEFDPAFESRVTLALKYSELEPSARSSIWKNFLGKSCSGMDWNALGKHVMNGRQIKNAVRLATALADETKEPLNQALIENTIRITEIGRADMNSAAKF